MIHYSIAAQLRSGRLKAHGVRWHVVKSKLYESCHIVCCQPTNLHQRACSQRCCLNWSEVHYWVLGWTPRVKGVGTSGLFERSSSTLQRQEEARARLDIALQSKSSTGVSPAVLEETLSENDDFECRSIACSFTFSGYFTKIRASRTPICDLPSESLFIMHSLGVVDLQVNNGVRSTQRSRSNPKGSKDRC